MSSSMHIDENRCAIALYLYGDSISLDDASQLLGLTPTRSRNRGEVRTTSSGSEVVQKIGFWEYRVKASVDQAASTVSEMVNGIACAKVVGEAGITKAELDIFVPLEMESEHAGFSFEFPAGLVLKLSRLGFDIVVTAR